METAVVKNWFSVIGQSWIDSLKIFLPQNFKLFLLASLNAFVKALPLALLFVGMTMLIVFPLTAALFILPFWVHFFSLSQAGQQTILVFTNWFVLLISQSFSLLGVTLAIRPSVSKKNINYFSSRLKYLPYIWALYCVMVLPYILYQFVYRHDYAFKLDIFSISGCFFIIFALFILDQKASITNSILAVKRTLQLIIYNFPFMVLSYASFYFFYYYLIMQIINLFARLLHINETNIFVLIGATLIGFSSTIFVYAWYSVFYTKRVHDQFELYF